MHKPSRMVPFIFGLVIGILGMIYVPKYVRPYIPDSLLGKGTIVKGTIVAKGRKGDALLVTVSTPQGALLATFLKKADEVNLLVNDKDEVEFTLDEYKPFIDDPLITRVVKALPADAPEPDKAPAVPAKAAVKTPLAAKPHAPVR